MDARTLTMLGKHSTIELSAQSLQIFLQVFSEPFLSASRIGAVEVFFLHEMLVPTPHWRQAEN
jgi:hypothetical protein